MSYCFYGEALLPNINTVWTDKSVYPYALIRSTINGDSGYPVLATLRVSTMLMYFDNSANSGTYRAVNAGSVIRYQFTESSGEWEYIDEIAYAIDEEVCTNFASAIGWTSHDILNEDGTLYLAASEPVPILAPTIEPLSMWMGWKAGNWVARQRGKKVVEEETDNGLGDSFPITFSVPDVLENTSFAYDNAELRYYKISNIIPTADELAAVTIAAEIIADEGSFSYDEIYIWSSTNDVGHLVANFGSVDYGFSEYYLAIPENSDGYEPGFYILNDGKGIWEIEDSTIQITMSKSE